MKINQRVGVEFVGSDGSRPNYGLHVSHLKVWALNRELSEEEVLNLVHLANFSGQSETIMSRCVELPEDDKFNKFHVYWVRVICDSGD
jgi:hypothetical protein